MSCRCGPCLVETGETHYCDAANDALVHTRREACPRCGPKRAESPKTPASPDLEAFVGELRKRHDDALTREHREGYTREAIAARQRAYAAYAAAKRAAELAGVALAPAPVGAGS